MRTSAKEVQGREMFDPACHDLARHFLGDLASEKLKDDLAQAIQDYIEDWLEYQRDERAKALNTQ